jgi:hypothetical protein
MRLFFISFFLTCGTWAFAQKAKAQTTFDLSEALQKKLVSLRITGTGGHQGESLKLICRNLSGRFLRVRIPQGQLMEPSDSAQQTLVVAEEQLLSVNTKTPVEASLKTFCTQAGEISPTAGATFSTGALASGYLCNLLKFIVEKGKTESAEAQSAVWCIMSGGHALGSVGDPELTKFIADLLGKDLPGYKIRHETVTEVPGRPAGLGKALVVEGNFVYFLEKDERTIMVLLDESGKLIKQISKEEVMKAGEHRSGLRLEVYNLDPGKYTVRMQTKGGRVIKDMNVDF